MERTKAVIVALVDVVPWIVQPDANLHGFALAAPAKDFLHCALVMLLLLFVVRLDVSAPLWGATVESLQCFYFVKIELIGPLMDLITWR